MKRDASAEAKSRIVTVSTVRVYSVPNVSRRYISKRAAISAYCRNRVRARHPCECEPDVGWDCNCHHGIEWYDELVDRYTRLVIRLEGKP